MSAKSGEDHFIAFNIGIHACTGSTPLRLLDVGAGKRCATAIVSSTKNKKLISRRTAERDHILTPYTQASRKALGTEAKPVSAPPSTLAPLDVRAPVMLILVRVPTRVSAPNPPVRYHKNPSPWTRCGRWLSDRLTRR